MISIILMIICIIIVPILAAFLLKEPAVAFLSVMMGAVLYIIIAAISLGIWGTEKLSYQDYPIVLIGHSINYKDEKGNYIPVYNINKYNIEGTQGNFCRITTRIFSGPLMPFTHQVYYTYENFINEPLKELK